MTLKPNTSQSFWLQLIEPHPDVQDRRESGRARLLAGVSLAFAVGMALYLLVDWVSSGQLDWIPLVSLVILSAAYFTSRSSRPQAGSLLLNGGLFVINFILILTGRSEITITVLMLLMLPILLSSLLLSGWFTLIFASATILMLLIISASAAWLDMGDLAGTFISLVVVLSIIVGVSFIRDRDIEQMGKQAEEVDEYSRRLESDVRRIATTAEVGRALAATRDLTDLLNLVVNLIVERFEEFYHAQVFLLDDMKRYAILRESTGEAGKELLRRNHRLEVGSLSVIGQVTSTGRAVIASDTDVDATHRRNELLPNTRAEMALPLQVGGRIIGALDIQSVHANAFGEQDITTFQTVADQLAIAIENTRLFDRAQRDLQDIERLNRQLTGDVWGRYIAARESQNTLGYYSGKEGVRPLTTGSAGELASGEDDEVYSVPLSIRGQTIGVIDVVPRGDKSKPDEKTQQMLNAVAERVAQALDNTRLAEESEQRALREQVLSSVSAELQATTDMDIILRIVAREASRAMGAQTGFVHLELYRGDSE